MPHPLSRLAAPVLALLLALLLAAGPHAQDRPQAAAQQFPPQPQQTQQPETFRSGIEMVAIDVTVVDRTGTPVEGLTPADFTVTVDGKPRRVVTAQFISHHGNVGAAALAPPPAGAPADALPNAVPPAPPARTGRDVMIVIDEDSLDTGDGQVARRAAMSLLDGLGPADRVGLAIIPRLKMNFTLTSDRIANERALAAWVPGVYVEPKGVYRIGVAEAFAIEGNDQQVREQVVSRECGARGRTDSTCARDVVSEARQLAMRMHARATTTVQALQSLARALRQIDGPKTMVLVSGGVMTPESMSIFTALETDLAASQVTLYTLYFEKVANNPSRAGLSPTQADDDRVEEHGLDNVTAAAGGTFLRVIGPAEAYFARVATELSASYLLGIEVAAADRNGRPHRVEVKVNRRGLDVHGRKQYVIPADKKPPRTDDGRDRPMAIPPVWCLSMADSNYRFIRSSRRCL